MNRWNWVFSCKAFCPNSSCFSRFLFATHFTGARGPRKSKESSDLSHFRSSIKRIGFSQIEHFQSKWRINRSNGDFSCKAFSHNFCSFSRFLFATRFVGARGPRKTRFLSKNRRSRELHFRAIQTEKINNFTSKMWHFHHAQNAWTSNAVLSPQM